MNPEREREVHVSARLQHIWNKNGRNLEHYAGDLSSMGCQENEQEYKYYIVQNYWQEVFLLSLEKYTGINAAIVDGSSVMYYSTAGRQVRFPFLLISKARTYRFSF